MLNGQMAMGIILCVSFLVNFTALMVLFMRDFVRYFDLVLSGNILAPNRLEEIADAYHVKTCFVLLLIAIVIHVASLVTLKKDA